MSRASALIRLIVLAWMLASCARGPQEAGPRPVTVPAVRRPAPTAPAAASPSPQVSQGVTRHTATAVPASTPEEQERLVVGGLEPLPDVGQWDEGAATPLASLLLQPFARSLLDPLSGALDLAGRWSMAGSKASFTLRRDATWPDGSKVTATTVVDILQRSLQAGKFPGVQAIRAVEDSTIEAQLEIASCPALMRVATWPLWNPSNSPLLATSGEAAPASQIVQSLPYEAEEVEYRLYADEGTLRRAWERDEVNSVVGASRLQMGELSGDHLPSQQAGPYLATLLFHMNDPLVAQAPVREALTLATDREQLFRDAYGFAPPALLTALLPPGHWAAPSQGLPVDRERAEELLDEAGWEDRDGDGVRENEEGQPLEVVLSTPLSADHRWEALTQELAAQWAALGIKAVPLYIEPYSLQERLHTGRWQVALLAYRVAADPDQTALWAKPAETDLLGNDLNITGYDNADVLNLMSKAAALPGCAPDARQPLYDNAWQALLEDRPLWPLFPLPQDEVHRPGVSWDWNSGR